MHCSLGIRSKQERSGLCREKDSKKVNFFYREAGLSGKGLGVHGGLVTLNLHFSILNTLCQSKFIN